MDVQKLNLKFFRCVKHLIKMHRFSDYYFSLMREYVTAKATENLHKQQCYFVFVYLVSPCKHLGLDGTKLKQNVQARL